MPLSTIMLNEVLRTLDSGAVVSLAFRTWDARRNRGGEYVEFEACRIHNHQTHAERLAERRAVKYASVEARGHKNPQHFKNSTRNLVVMPSGEIRKLHIRLIRKFNGKTVL
jgi:hypothetical protein